MGTSAMTLGKSDIESKKLMRYASQEDNNKLRDTNSSQIETIRQTTTDRQESSVTDNFSEQEVSAVKESPYQIIKKEKSMKIEVNSEEITIKYSKDQFDVSWMDRYHLKVNLKFLVLFSFVIFA